MTPLFKLHGGRPLRALCDLLTPDGPDCTCRREYTKPGRSAERTCTCSASESCRILLLLCASDFEHVSQHVHVGTMHAQLWTFPFLRPVLRAGLPTPAPNSPSDITPTRHHWSGSQALLSRFRNQLHETSRAVTNESYQKRKRPPSDIKTKCNPNFED